MVTTFVLLSLASKKLDLRIFNFRRRDVRKKCLGVQEQQWIVTRALASHFFSRKLYLQISELRVHSAG